MEPNLAALDQVRITAIDLGMKFGPKLFIATVILVAGYLAARWIGGAVGRWLDRFEFEPPVRQLMLSFTRVLIFGLFAIMALQNLGVELVPLLAGLGVAGAGIALAMQGVLGNLVAGMTIILTRPFRVGEYISIAREEGEVVEIRLASTTLSHADRSRVVIPNRRIVGEILHNYGQMRQLQVRVGVAYDADLKQAFKAIREVLDSSARVLKDPAPVLGVSSFDDSSIIIGVGPWANLSDCGPAGDEIYRAILEAFRQRGIVIPFPQREVRMLGKAA
jgi:small conductance mechanosensitive channel